MQAIITQLNQYKRKFYLNQILKGILLSSAILLSAYLLLNTLEFFGKFGTTVRAIFFFTFVILLILSVSFWIITPLLQYTRIRSQLSNEEAAQQIGDFFPDIRDQLLNALQLQQIDNPQSELLRASIQQKTDRLSVFHFPDAIRLEKNKKYLRYLLPPLLILLLLLIFSREFITSSSARILNYSKKYVPKAPFRFLVQNKKMSAFRNEDFTVQLTMKGSALPQVVYINTGTSRLKMRQKDGKFFYTFKKLQKAQSFYFDAAGFDSQEYEIQLIERPNLLNFVTYIQYPAYLNKPKEAIKNLGNLTVPQGSIIEWNFNTLHTDSLNILLTNQKKWLHAKKQDDTYSYKLRLNKSLEYQVHLKNRYSHHTKPLEYSISVIPDQVPSISIETFADTTLYSYVMVGGNVGDDYGLTQLKLFYRITSKKRKSAFRPINIPLKPGQNVQKYFYQLNLNTIKIGEGERLEYFTQVWDNDGVNGHKSAKSITYKFSIPSKKEMVKKIDETVTMTENKIDQTIQKAKALKKQLKDFENKVKTKKSLDFNDKKQLEDLLKQKNELEQNMQQLNELTQQYNDKQNRLNPQQQKETQQKLQELQELMNQVMDEKTKKLYDKLQELIQKNRSEKQMLDVLEKINKSEQNFQQDLERTLEMYKQMQIEQKMQKVSDDLKDLSEQQKKLAEQTKNANPKDQKQNQALQKKQQELNQKFEQTKKDLQDIKQKNQELEFPNPPLEDQKQNEISQKQKDATQQLQKQDNKNAEKSQKDAAQKMKEMQEELEAQQASMQSEKQSENMEHLRMILENLLELSFEQEKLMKEMRRVSLVDPRFVEMGQRQLKLKDDAKIVRDSLIALSKRSKKIQPFVTKELTDMDNHMDKSTQAIKERKQSLIARHQQYTMTSINNLALMLSDILDQMKKNASKGGKSKGKGNKNNPDLSSLQKKLNEQIQQLQKSGQQGQKLSEQLAKMAAQQEKIRRMLEQMKKNGELGKDGGGDQVKELLQQMEKTEEDLVNKRLTQKLINRQKKIETKLLQSEKAKRERDLDDKRKANTAKPKSRRIPPQLKKYYQQKHNQKEHLRKIPPTLSPYYKKEVDKYFKQSK